MGSLIKEISIWSIVILLVCTLSGCSTLDNARMAKGKGPFKVYDVSEDKVWAAIRDVIKSSGLGYAGEDRQEGYVLAARNPTAFSWGENVAIFITSLDNDQKTRVEIVSKKVITTNIFAPDWSVRLFKALDALFVPIVEK